MDTARVAALLEPFIEQPLSPFQLEQISTYIDLLQRWNARINLTAIRHEEEIVTRHFGESFFLARHLFPASVARTLLSATADTTRQPAIPPFPRPCHPERRQDMRFAHVWAESKDPYISLLPELPQGILPVPSNSPRVLDIGSGAGFPALPLKLWAPHIHLTLIESNHKKAVFLREVVRALTLTNINVLTGRAQALAPSLTAQADVVTLRAVERLETILPQAVTFLAPKGTLALLITTPQTPRVLAQTNLRWQAQMNVPKSHSRVLLVGYKA
jgi:16S rRNA (guanine(527)-N(7))-methyltransferase RsmG